MSKQAELTRSVQAQIERWPHSRTHPLKTFSTATARCYVKRDDELSCGVSGSKLRKYVALLPYLVAHNYAVAILIGGAHSNHVVGMSQLLLERGLQPILFLRGEPGMRRQGNLLLTSLLVEAKHLHWVSRADWPQVEQLATNHAQRLPHKSKVIPEGAFMAAALPGALTLILDSLHNAAALALTWQHIFIDAGTGFTAMATILGLAWLDENTCVHVILLADKPAVFLKKLRCAYVLFEQFMATALSWPAVQARFKLHTPSHARSFGAVNATVLQTIQGLARGEGFLTDPVYSAKMFVTAQQIIHREALAGNILLVHSGGALSLLGFQAQLAKLVE